MSASEAYTVTPFESAFRGVKRLGAPFVSCVAAESWQTTPHSLKLSPSAQARVAFSADCHLPSLPSSTTTPTSAHVLMRLRCDVMESKSHLLHGHRSGDIRFPVPGRVVPGQQRHDPHATDASRRRADA